MIIVLEYAMSAKFALRTFGLAQMLHGIISTRLRAGKAVSLQGVLIGDVIRAKANIHIQSVANVTLHSAMLVLKNAEQLGFKSHALDAIAKCARNILIDGVNARTVSLVIGFVNIALRRMANVVVAEQLFYLPWQLINSIRANYFISQVLAGWE